MLERKITGCLPWDVYWWKKQQAVLPLARYGVILFPSRGMEPVIEEVSPSARWWPASPVTGSGLRPATFLSTTLLSVTYATAQKNSANPSLTGTRFIRWERMKFLFMEAKNTRGIHATGAATLCILCAAASLLFSDAVRAEDAELRQLINNQRARAAQFTGEARQLAGTEVERLIALRC